MSLWPVNDKAGRLFMQFFYAHLDAGPAAAVRMAQLDMVAKTEYKQPVYWAGYAYSGDPTAGAWRKAAPAPASGAGESVVTPTCVELTTHREDGTYNLMMTYRVRIAGAVRRSASSAERVVYDLLPPASDLERSSAMSVNHGPPQDNPEVHVASHSNFPVSLTIERTKDGSALYVREYVAEGDQRYKPQTVTLITLKGGPAVFPTFDIPTAFPAVSSYTEASVSRGTDAGSLEKIDRVAACPAQR